MNNRGQTVYDFLFGMLLVLLTIAAVFGFFPDVFVPFEETVDPENQHMADRLAEEVVHVNATMRDERTVNVTALNRTLGDPDSFERLLNRSGIPAWKQVNVTVQDGDGDILAAGATGDVGSVYRDESSDATARRVRTIRAHNRTSACADGCRVVVRVWVEGQG